MAIAHTATTVNLLCWKLISNSNRNELFSTSLCLSVLCAILARFKVLGQNFWLLETQLHAMSILPEGGEKWVSGLPLTKMWTVGKSTIWKYLSTGHPRVRCKTQQFSILGLMSELLDMCFEWCNIFHKCYLTVSFLPLAVHYALTSTGLLIRL